MKLVHVECKPDELLVKELGIPRKNIIHHQGKSRIFSQLKKVKQHVAIVDEDPYSCKTRYEDELEILEQTDDIKVHIDKAGNKVLMLKGKLEDWIVLQCQANNINMQDFSLPVDPDKLHDVINHKLNNFQNLLRRMKEVNVPALRSLKKHLTL